MDNGKTGRNIKNFRKNLQSFKDYFSSSEKFLNGRNKYIYVVILIIGIILLTLPEFDNGETFNEYSADEERLCNIISKIKDCGEVSAMITYSEPEKYGDEKGKALGAIIVYGGPENSEVEIKISEAVEAALDLPPHKVKVYKSE